MPNITAAQPAAPARAYPASTLPPPSGGRSASMELLRILSMGMIVLLHALTHGGAAAAARPFSSDWFFLYALEGLCYVSVNCYVLLSGYFLVKSHFRLQKLVALALQILFYSIATFLFFYLRDEALPDAGTMRNTLLPVFSGAYWFVSVYVALYLLSPMLNRLVHAMNRAQHARCCIAFLLISSVWNTLAPFSTAAGTGGGTGLAWFLCLYLAAAWMRLYGVRRLGWRWLALYAALALVAPAWKLAASANNWPRPDGLFLYDSIPVALASLALFAWFVGLPQPRGMLRQAALEAAPLTFGVYLLHDNPLVRWYLWQKAALPQYVDGYHGVLRVLVASAGVFFACLAAEWVRSTLMRPLVNSRALARLCAAAQDALCRACAALERACAGRERPE